MTIWNGTYIGGDGVALLSTTHPGAVGRWRKRTSKRRWKARARLGKLIPKIAIFEHQLQGPWVEVSPLTQVYTRVFI